MKIKVTQLQRDNLLSALNEMWPSVPPGNVYEDLRDWRNDDSGPVSCGTIGCFGFWCTVWPAFRAQGVYAAWDGCPLSKDTFDISMKLFGGRFLFAGRSQVNTDFESSDHTDHEIVTRRLQRLLENSEVMTKSTKAPDAS